MTNWLQCVISYSYVIQYMAIVYIRSLENLHNLIIITMKYCGG